MCHDGKGRLTYFPWFSDFFQSMFAYDKTFDPEVVLGHCDLISWLSDFALYLDTRLVYFHTFFRL